MLYPEARANKELERLEEELERLCDKTESSDETK